jgi:hypothetical protein
MAYGTSLLGLSQRMAAYVDRILKGTSPGRACRRATDGLRTGDQPQDREGARPHDPALGARAGGRGDRVTPRVVRLTQPSFSEIGMRPRLESASLSGLTERGLGP